MSALALSVLLSLVSAVAYAAGAIVQEQVAVSSPDEQYAPLRRPGWWAAVALNGLGGLLHVVALAYGPLSLVQPLGALTIVVALPMAALFVGRKAGATAWRGAIMATVGLAGLLSLVAASQAQSLASAERVAVALVTAGVVVALMIAGRAAHRHPAVRSMLLATASGIAFGMSSVFTKTVAVDWTGGVSAADVPSLAVIGVLATAGMLLSQASYRGAGLAAPLATLTVVNPVVAAAVGITMFGETFRYGSTGTALALSCGVVAAGGLILLTTERLAHAQPESAGTGLEIAGTGLVPADTGLGVAGGLPKNGGLHETVGALPERVGRLTEAVGGLPETVGDPHETVADLQTTPDRVPETVGSLSATTGIPPRTGGNLPTTPDRVPETVGSPSVTTGIPPRTGGNLPTTPDRVPETVGSPSATTGIPPRTGGNLPTTPDRVSETVGSPSATTGIPPRTGGNLPTTPDRVPETVGSLSKAQDGLGGVAAARPGIEGAVARMTGTGTRADDAHARPGAVPRPGAGSEPVTAGEQLLAELSEDILVPSPGSPPAPEGGYEDGEPSAAPAAGPPLPYGPFYGGPYVPMPVVGRRRIRVKS